MFHSLSYNISRFDELNSTNAFLKQRAEEGHSGEGELVLASFQKNGKGQGNNTWESEKNKNLLMSLLLEPSFIKATEQVYLNIAISLALTDTLTQLGIKNTFIKWPNDIYIGNKKTGGILLENSLQNNSIRYCIAGIGLNLNQTDFATNKATSVFLETGREQKLDLTLEQVTHHISARYGQLKSRMLSALWDEYHERLYKMNQPSYFRIGDEVVLAEITGIDKEGKLEVLLNKQLQYFANKEIELL